MSQDNNTYLLEIGTEELPPGFMKQLPELLKNGLSQLFTDADVAFADIKVYLTPRRMALLVSGLPNKQPTQQTIHKGPPVRIAFDADGQPAKAAQAFASKIGVSVEQLQRDSSGKEETLFFQEERDGLAVPELLKTLIPELIFSLSGPRFMHWGLEHDGKLLRFPRPIRWLLSLWNETHAPITLGYLQSGTTTRGHRFLSVGEFTVQSSATYLQQLQDEGFVIADPDLRRQQIETALAEKAQQLNGVIPANEALLDEVNQLVEWPWVLQGEIEDKYLGIPKPVIITAMASHQRYFPIEDNSGHLMPYFFTISNGKQDAAETIKKGNQRVLTARLEDARFFYDDDTKETLESRLDSLKGITFQRGLGSIYDKAQRMKSLSETLATMLGCEASVVNHAKRAALLSKCDLTTSMVFEFTELQGEIGQHYARKDGEPVDVSTAIFEQYLPRYAGEQVAESPAGIVVSLAEKLDTLVTVFCQKKAKIPTGSKDPLALRRAVNGILLTILENDLTLDLKEAAQVAYALAPQSDNDEKITEGETWQRLEEFILQRFKGLLLDQDLPYDVIDAVLASEAPLSHVNKMTLQANALYQLTKNTGVFQKIYEPANRIAKILGSNFNGQVRFDDVNAGLLKEPAEKDLYEAINQQASLFDHFKLEDQEALLTVLKNMQPVIAQFFDDVMVNDPDAAVRQNRHNLLSVLHKAYLHWGLFTRLVVDSETLQPLAG